MPVMWFSSVRFARERVQLETTEGRLENQKLWDAIASFAGVIIRKAQKHKAREMVASSVRACSGRNNAGIRIWRYRVLFLGEKLHLQRKL